MCPGLYIPEDIVYFALDIGDQVELAHDWDLEYLLAAMGHNSKYKAVIGVKKPLIEKKGCVQDSYVDIALHVCNYL